MTEQPDTVLAEWDRRLRRTWAAARWADDAAIAFVEQRRRARERVRFLPRTRRAEEIQGFRVVGGSGEQRAVVASFAPKPRNTTAKVLRIIWMIRGWSRIAWRTAAASTP
jgi:hypothetical protein